MFSLSITNNDTARLRPSYVVPNSTEFGYACGRSRHVSVVCSSALPWRLWRLRDRYGRWGTHISVSVVGPSSPGVVPIVQRPWRRDAVWSSGQRLGLQHRRPWALAKRAGVWQEPGSLRSLPRGGDLVRRGTSASSPTAPVCSCPWSLCVCHASLPCSPPLLPQAFVYVCMVEASEPTSCSLQANLTAVDSYTMRMTSQLLVCACSSPLRVR